MFWFFHWKKQKILTFYGTVSTTKHRDSPLCQSVHPSRKLQQGSLGLLNSKYALREMRYVYKLQEPLCQHNCSCWSLSCPLAHCPCWHWERCEKGEQEWKFGGISFGQTSRGFISGDNPSTCLMTGYNCRQDNVKFQPCCKFGKHTCHHGLVVIANMINLSILD